MPSNQDQTIWEKLRPFIFGGVSGMSATICVQPMDNIKVRIQTYAELKSMPNSTFDKSLLTTSILKTGRRILKEEGVKSLYRGLDSGLLRQLCYASVRLGVYKYVYEKRLEECEKTGKEITFFERLGLSLFSGFVGSVVGNPLDLSLVRFQSEAMLPPEQKRGYKHVFDALRRIPKEEGIKTYWRGFPSFALRVMALTSSQLTTFDEIKLMINNIRGIDQPDFLTRIMYFSLINSSILGLFP